MSDDKFKIGTMVVLSTTPDVEMAVTNLPGEGAEDANAIQCAWFDAKRHLQIAVFPRGALRLTTSREDNRALHEAKAEVTHLKSVVVKVTDELEQNRAAVTFYKTDVQEAVRLIRPFIGTVPANNAGEAARAIGENFERYKKSATDVVDQVKEELKQTRAKLIELGYIGPLVQ